jgi:hypothetical protein
MERPMQFIVLAIVGFFAGYGARALWADLKRLGYL